MGFCQARPWAEARPESSSGHGAWASWSMGCRHVGPRGDWCRASGTADHSPAAPRVRQMQVRPDPGPLGDPQSAQRRLGRERHGVRDLPISRVFRSRQQQVRKATRGSAARHVVAVAGGACLGHQAQCRGSPPAPCRHPTRCRGLVDGIEAVIHQTRTTEGVRHVEQRVRVRGLRRKREPLGRRTGLATADSAIGECWSGAIAVEAVIAIGIAAETWVEANQMSRWPVPPTAERGPAAGLILWTLADHRRFELIACCTACERYVVLEHAALARMTEREGSDPEVQAPIRVEKREEFDEANRRAVPDRPPRADHQRIAERIIKALKEGTASSTRAVSPMCGGPRSTPLRLGESQTTLDAPVERIASRGLSSHPGSASDPTR